MKIFAINLERRTDRKAHMRKEFGRFPEFELIIVKAIEDEVGAIGLWKTIKSIVNNAILLNDEYILICEDDHQFTKNYRKESFLNAIIGAQTKEADILLGGVSWFNDAVQVGHNLFWVEKFSGLQFVVIYRKFFSKISIADFHALDAADYKISNMTENKFLIHPFISVQKEFGYSDVTPKNNEDGRVSRIFESSADKLLLIRKVADFYNLRF